MDLDSSARSEASFRIRLSHCPSWAIRSHGWVHLEPFRHQGQSYLYAFRRSSTNVVVRFTPTRRSELEVTILAPDNPPKKLVQEVETTLAYMFRADEDFRDFWRKCESIEEMQPCADLRLGALLRSATIFEDAVKTLCTTNCHWRNTKRMVKRLCENFGESVETKWGQFWTFPEPDRLASATLEELAETGIGFRAEYLSGFAKQVAEGLDVEKWVGRRNDPSLFEEIRSIRGFGEYSTRHILVMAGDYSRVPFDSDVISYLGISPALRPSKVRDLIDQRYKSWQGIPFLGYKFERIMKRRNYVNDIQPGHDD